MKLFRKRIAIVIFVAILSIINFGSNYGASINEELFQKNVTWITQKINQLQQKEPEKHFQILCEESNEENYLSKEYVDHLCEIATLKKTITQYIDTLQEHLTEDIDELDRINLENKIQQLQSYIREADDSIILPRSPEIKIAPQMLTNINPSIIPYFPIDIAQLKKEKSFWNQYKKWIIEGAIVVGAAATTYYLLYKSLKTYYYSLYKSLETKLEKQKNKLEMFDKIYKNSLNFYLQQLTEQTNTIKKLNKTISQLLPK